MNTGYQAGRVLADGGKFHPHISHIFHSTTHHYHSYGHSYGYGGSGSGGGSWWVLIVILVIVIAFVAFRYLRRNS